MTHPSALFLARCPLAWHLEYWLSLTVIGILRGEDAMLMFLRVEIEHSKMADQEMKSRLDDAWNQHLIAHIETHMQLWNLISLESGAAKRYLRDLDRLLVDKGAKARTYLGQMESLMLDDVRAGRVGRAREILEMLGQIYQRLQAEERDEAEARYLANGAFGIYHQEEQGQDLLWKLLLNAINPYYLDPTSRRQF